MNLKMLLSLLPGDRRCRPQRRAADNLTPGESGAVESVHLASLENLPKALGCEPGYVIVKSGK